MKDLTQDWCESVRSESLDSGRSYILMGEKQVVPEHVFESMIKLNKYFEMESIKEVTDNYSNLIIRQRVPFRTTMWIISLFGKISKKMKLMKEFMEFDMRFGYLQRELYSNDRKVTDILTRHLIFPAFIVLTDIKLENFKHISNDLFSAYTFDLVDTHSNRIEGVFVYDEYFEQILSPKEKDVINRRTSIETARSSDAGKTWIVYAMPLTEQYKDFKNKSKTRNKRLMVRHIQDGGSSIKTDMPFLMIR